MKRVLVAVLMCACIDREGTLAEFCRLNNAPDCPDAGTGGGSAGGSAGGGSTGGGTAGGGATGGGGGGGGTGGGSPIDAGPQCPGSTAQRLSCTVVNLQDGGTSSWPWLSSNDAGFLAAWAHSPASIEVRQINAAGAMTSLVSSPTASVPSNVAVAGAGAHWAAVWREATSAPTRCASSVNPTPSDIDAGVAALGSQSVAVSPAGAVGVVARASSSFTTDPYLAEASAGCPSQFDGRHSGLGYARGVGAVYQPTREEFVYTLTAFDSIGSAGVMHMFRRDGGERSKAGLERLGDHTAALSDDGAILQVVTAPLDGGLALRTLQSDFSTSIPNGYVAVSGRVNWWQSAACGPDCFAVTWVDDLGGGAARVKVQLTSAQSVLQGSPYDVVCSDALSTTFVGVASSEGKLGFLVTHPASVDLYVCDRP